MAKEAIVRKALNTFECKGVKVALWGAGKCLRENIHWLKEIYDVVYIVDNDRSKWGDNLCGINVMPPDVLRGRKTDVLITVEDQRMKEEIKRSLLEYGLCERSFKDEGAGKGLYVWGTPEECRRMYFLLGESQSEFHVSGFITLWVENVGTDEWLDLPVISLFKAEDKLRNHLTEGILAIADTYHFDLVTRENVDDDILEDDGFYISKKNYITDIIRTNEEVKPGMLMIPYKNYCRFRSLQLTVTAKCNLNCRLCTHFAALVDKNENYSFEEYERDVKKAAEVIEDVDNIDVWGGEALLCDYLPQALRTARECFPRADVYIGTNGLLILKMEQELIDAIHETGAVMVISMYPPTLKIIDDIVGFLKKNHIGFIYGKERIRSNTFRKMFNIRGEADPETAWSNCVCGKNMSCHVMYKGKWSQCYLPMFSVFFNAEFGNLLDTCGDVIDIYSADFNKENIIKHSRSSMPSCRYCAPYTYERWQSTNGQTTLDDWVYH